MVSVIANGQQKVTEDTALTFYDVVRLCVGDVLHPGQYSITYRNKESSGTLSPGERLFARDGMVFNAAITRAS